MAESSPSRNMKLFAMLFQALDFFGVSKFKNKQSIKLEIVLRTYSCFLMSLFSLLLISGYLTYVYSKTYDSVTNFARSIDRFAMVFISIGICGDATFRSKLNQTLIGVLDGINGIISSKFAVKLNYRKIALLFGFLAVTNFLPLIIMIQESLSFELNAFNAAIVLVYVTGKILVVTVKVLHYLIVVLFFIHCKVVAKIVDSMTKDDLCSHQYNFFDLFDKLRSFVELFNDSFSFVVLMNVGKEKFKNFRVNNF